MKVVFILTMILINSWCAYSQIVSIELSIHWCKEKNPITLKDDSIPYLNISYHNSSNTSLYFPRFSQGKTIIPDIVISGGLVGNLSFVKKSKDLYYDNYSGNKYSILLEPSHDYLFGWEVISDTLINKEHQIDLINDDLVNIYEYICSDKNNKTDYHENGAIKLEFSTSDISPHGILNTVNDRFIFLKPGEDYMDTYNLIGFKLVQGDFTFYIKKSHFTNYVNIDPIWDEGQSRYISRTAELPCKVGEYILYSGEFKSNEITVSF